MLTPQQTAHVAELLERLKSEVDEARGCLSAGDLDGYAAAWAKAKPTMAEVEALMPANPNPL